MGDWKQEAGAWIRFNPVDGSGVKNENVTRFTYALVESDTLPIAEQDILFRKLELPIAALVHSGGKSLHAIVRVDAENYERLIPIEGTPVDMLNPPEGCPFAPRCEHCMKICLKKMPPYVEIGGNHRSACWLRVLERLNGKNQDKEGNADGNQ